MLEDKVTYDSFLEEDFHKKFVALKSDWNIIREPEPLVVGTRIFIPDFVFVKDNEKVYLEIVGFWTNDYMKRKIEKLKELKNVKMIIAIDESIDKFELGDLPYTIIKFKRSLPSYEVLKVLNSIVPKSNHHIMDKDLGLNKAILESTNLDGMKLIDVIKIFESNNINESDIDTVLKKLGYEIEWNTLDPNQAIVRKRRS